MSAKSSFNQSGSSGEGLDRVAEVERRDSSWTGLPRPLYPRWTLPRHPHADVTRALYIYHPVTLRGFLGWHAARALAASGGFRSLPPGRPPPAQIRALSEETSPGWQILAVARTNHPQRYVALLESPAGDQRFLKVDQNEVGRGFLEREAEALKHMGPLLGSPLHAPTVHGHGPGYVLLEGIAWRPRVRAWQLPEEVARSLGKWFASGDASQDRGLVHGDFAPWNLYRTDRGWTILDWEDARDHGAPFHDVFNYVVMSHSLLGRPRQRGVLQGLRGAGWVGAAMRGFAAGAGLDTNGLMDRFCDYLETSKEKLDLSRRDGRIGLRARERLLLSVAAPRKGTG
ncbi:MAG: aminoglycoside phosphotransferase family protein [Actinomycetota bacterium]|nr:aminoglycoside phosphotransferase family protein [Actinomycetota bacterium]